MNGLARILWLIIRLVQGPARWFARRFTTAGAMVVAGMLVSLGTANPAQTLGLPAFLLLGALVTIGFAWILAFRVRIRLERHLPRLAPCGESISFPVTLHNPSARWQRGLLYGENLRTIPMEVGAVLDWLRRGRFRHTTSSPVEVPPIPPRSSVTVSVTLTARRRGILNIPGGLLSRSDPLGLVRAFQFLPGPASLLVLPQRHRIPDLDLPGFRRQHPGGEALASGVGAAEEFASLRDYRRGDPRKHIHWRSTARTGTLVVKEFHDEEVIRHALVLDPGVEGVGSRFEDAVSVAASFVGVLPEQESLLDLLFIGSQAVQLTSGRGVGHSGPMLEALASVTPRPEGFQALEALVLLHAHRLSGCILVLLAYDRPRADLVRHLRNRGIPVVVALIGPAPAVIPPEDRPDRLVVLEPGQIAQGLAALGGRR